MQKTELFQNEFLQFEKELKSFIYRLVAHRQDTEDIFQETYLKTFKNLDSFRQESSFKTWVFAIAANHAKDFLRSKKRWKEDYQDQCRKATYASKEIQMTMGGIAQNSSCGRFVLKEHVDYCFTCLGKTLLVQDQVCLILKEIYGFKNKEIATITELTLDKVKHSISNSRNKMIQIFEKRCTLINKEGMCHQCSELNGMFNPQQNFEEEKMKLKMVREQKNENYESLLNLRFELLKGIDPIEAEGFDLHNYMLENVPNHVTLAS